jgi:predicted small secreted protein
MMKRILFAFFAAALLATAVTGCNTMRGAGEDVENTGEAIQDTVD